MKRAGIAPHIPPNPAPHIIDRLVEIGMSEAAGMGAAPLSWATIDAWQRVTATPLQPWEARLLRRLSIDYLAESRRAEQINAPPPAEVADPVQKQDDEEALLRSVLG